MLKIVGGFILGLVTMFIANGDLSAMLDSITHPFSTPATFSVSREVPTTDANMLTTIMLYRVAEDYTEHVVRKSNVKKEHVATLFNNNGAIKSIQLADGNYTVAWPNSAGHLCEKKWFMVKNGWLQNPTIDLGNCG